MNLPASFLQMINTYFEKNPELNLEAFLESFDESPRRGVRLNSWKTASDDIKQILDSIGASKRVLWSENGYYIDTEGLGKNPYYHAGAYYIQEPSAMLPAEILSPNPGDFVLDLCAAPGGKTTRLGEMMRGEGLLVSNEISKDRVRALLRNVELFGLDHMVITNETPEKLAERLPGFFDKILVDAPCSGEGMFRRDPQAVRSWEQFGPSHCRTVQEEILDKADVLLKDGGEIVYSTCTFNSLENENLIDFFLQKHDEYHVVSHTERSGVTHCNGEHFQGAMRIWPHLSEGDGHFCVHLQKGTASSRKDSFIAAHKKKREHGEVYSVRVARDIYLQFCKEILTDTAYDDVKERAERYFLLYGDKTHILPVSPIFFDHLKVVKMGAFPGTIKHTEKGSFFIPSHSFALSISKEKMQSNRCLSLEYTDERIWRYLSGETVFLNENEQMNLSKKGYILLTIGSRSLGWGKRNGMMLKNDYPAAWRLR